MSSLALHFRHARSHAKHRAWERFGLAIGEGELREIEARLIAGDYSWVADLRNFCVAYEAPFRGKTLYPIFNIRLWSIVTFLPCEAWACHRALRDRR